MRQFLPLCAILLLAACTAGPGDYTDLVDPFIGTGGHGHTYPGATLPFGMVQLSPDTRLTGWDGCSGYHYSDEVIYGFSHTHLSGTGASDYGDVLLVPTVGEVVLDNGADGGAGYSSPFRHDREAAEPGYYRVYLDEPGVEVELTATLRTGLHRYTFPRTGQANVILDLEHRDTVLSAGIEIVSGTEIAGHRLSTMWAREQHVYFVIRFSRPFAEAGLALDGVVQPDRDEIRGNRVKAFFTFSNQDPEPLLVKVGLSAVDIDGARRNLEAEQPGFNFSRVRTAADSVWNDELSAIEVRGGSRAQQRTFYTALYHALLSPDLYQDVDGRYRGRDMQVHTADDFDNHTVFSLWDTFRAAHPLFTLIQQRRTRDFIRTFLVQYEQGGLLPVWELAGNETGTMIGYHAVPVIADAWVKGQRDYDGRLALEAMVTSGESDVEGLDAYREHGYIPSEIEGESVAKTLEYAYDDWCISEVAREMGRDDIYRRYIRRSQYWKNVFDPQTGFMRGKLNGRWVEPFKPQEVTIHFTEANSWQYSFFVPHDIAGHIALVGGEAAYEARLDSLFAADPRTTGRRQADITGLIGQYAHGNEPSHHMAYLFNYVGAPHKSARRVRQIMDTLYSDTPDGLSGNEDCGQMSAWYVLSALGFYPVCPGRPEYVIGSPLFPEAVIHFENGRQFTIRARGASAERPCVLGAFLNGVEHPFSWIGHDAIVAGGEIEFLMGAEPDPEWGRAPGHRPHSAVTDHPITPVPFLTSGDRSFSGSTEVALGLPIADGEIRYTLDGSEPNAASRLYTAPFTITRNTTLRARALRTGAPPSQVVTARFYALPEGWSIDLHSRYANQYAAGGDLALIDQLRGPADFHTGLWQGYEGIDLEAVVDLGRVRTIRELGAGFLQDVNSWIWMPLEVEFALSTNGETFTVTGTVENEVPEDEWGTIRRDFTLPAGTWRARYVRVRARNRGECPGWHKGAGGRAWIFADEIIIR